jgi:hypothetical protein
LQGMGYAILLLRWVCYNRANRQPSLSSKPHHERKSCPMAALGPITPQAIEFYGDEILAVQDQATGRVYVPFGRLCDNLGIDRASQSERLQAHEVLKEGLITLAIQTAGGVQDTQCLRLDLIPFWLAGINAKRVKPAQRNKLVLYQRECAAVLWDAFRPGGQPSSTALAAPGGLSPAAQAYEMAMAIATLARQQMNFESQLSDVAAHVGEQAERITALELKLTPKNAITEVQAAELSQAIKFVARELGEMTHRNEYGGVYGQLYRAFGIVSYRNLPIEQFDEAMGWLREWYRRLKRGESEPPQR